MKNSPNVNHILSLIREKGKIHQRDLADLLDLEKSTVSRIVKKLMDGRIVRMAGEIPASRRGGRKPVLLELNPDGAYAVGIDFDVEQTKIAIIDLSGKVRSQTSCQTPSDSSPESVIPFLEKKIRSFLGRNREYNEKLTGIGIGTPGIIDYHSGTIISAVNLDNWDKVPIAPMLTDMFLQPVYVDNSIRTMALAEKWYGNGKTCKDFLCVGIRYGIGLAIIHRDQLIRGSHNQAGDIHISMDPNGPKCHCGRHGCIEALAGIKAIVEEYDSENLQNTMDICQGLKEGNEKLVSIVRKSGLYIGQTIAHLTEIFDPEKVILGGPLIEVNDIFFNSICKSYNDYSLKDRQLVPEISKTQLNRNGIVIGAGILALQNAFK